MTDDQHVTRTNIYKYFGNQNTLPIQDYILLPSLMFQLLDQTIQNESKGDNDTPHSVNICHNKIAEHYFLIQ